VDVFDSSVWLWGLLTNAPEPNRLVDEVLDGDRTVAVDAYIHDEVTRAFDRVDGAAGPDVTSAQMTFNDVVADLDNVVFPDQDEIGRTNAPEVAGRPEMRLLGTVLDIQAKDAPVLVFAFDVGGETTLYVADEGFTLSPADYGITTVRVENVDVPT
jgi:hypothetical protein